MEEELKQRILAYRAKHSITQEEMAKILGVSCSTLIRFMKNKSVTLDITHIKMKVKLDELEGK